MNLRTGWYKVVVRNNTPSSNEVGEYKEWVYYSEGIGWDISCMGNVTIIQVISREYQL